MNKFFRGILATLAGLFLVAAILTVILIFIDCVETRGLTPLWYLPVAAALGASGYYIMKAVDHALGDTKED